MRMPATIIVSASLLVVLGCASTAPKNHDTVKFHVSEAAEKLIEERGETLAAMRGYSDDSPLVCERFQQTGSHIKLNACYTREEMKQRRLNHQESYRYFTRGGPCMPNIDPLTGQAVGPVRSMGCGGG